MPVLRVHKPKPQRQPAQEVPMGHVFETTGNPGVLYLRTDEGCVAIGGSLCGGVPGHAFRESSLVDNFVLQDYGMLKCHVGD